jgi:IclR family transcriptional regulator, KDG regulon repressor
LTKPDTKILARGLTLLDILAKSDEGMTAADLAISVGIHKTSIYRYLNSLLLAGYVKTNGNGVYRLGMKILELSSHVLRRMPLRETAHPFIARLSSKTRKTVHLCVLDGHDVVYIDKVESQQTLPILSRIGSRAPAYCTGVGKALLSGLPTDEVVSLLEAAPLSKRTSTTITDPMKLLEEIRLTSERGYAVDDGEHEEGIKCYAALIRGFDSDIKGAISITGLKREFDRASDRLAFIEALTEVATEISRAVGCT